MWSAVRKSISSSPSATPILRPTSVSSTRPDVRRPPRCLARIRRRSRAREGNRESRWTAAPGLPLETTPPKFQARARRPQRTQIRAGWTNRRRARMKAESVAATGGIGPRRNGRRTRGGLGAPMGNIQINIESINPINPLSHVYQVVGQIIGNGVHRAGIYVDGRLVKRLPVSHGRSEQLLNDLQDEAAARRRFVPSAPATSTSSRR